MSTIHSANHPAPAPRLSRLWALLLDFTLAFLSALLPAALIDLTGSIINYPSLSRVLFDVAGNAVTVSSIAGFGLFMWFAAYFIIGWVHFKGQTPGKKLFGLRVVHGNNKRTLTYPEAAIRIVSLIVLEPITWVTIFFTERRRCIHDMLAGTIVIKA